MATFNDPSIAQLAQLKIQESEWAGPCHGYDSPPTRIWSNRTGSRQLCWWSGSAPVAFDDPDAEFLDDIEPGFELSIVLNHETADEDCWMGDAPRNLAQARAIAAAIFTALDANPTLATEIAVAFGIVQG